MLSQMGKLKIVQSLAREDHSLWLISNSIANVKLAFNPK
jgi:hypothetical protein